MALNHTERKDRGESKQVKSEWSLVFSVLRLIMHKLKKPERVRFMYQAILIEGVLKKTPPIKDVYNSIYEVSAESIRDIDMEDLYYED